MLVIFTIINAFFALVGYRKFKTIFNPLIILDLLFGICVPLGSIGLYGVNIPSKRTIVYMLIGQVVFNIVYLFSYHIKLRTKKSDYSGFSYKYDRRILYFLAVISLIYTARKFAISFSLLLSGVSISDVRSSYFSGGIVTSAFDDFLDTGVVSGIRIALMIIVVSEFFFEKKKDFFLYFLVILNIMMRVFTSGGRMFLFDFIMCILFCTSYQKYVFTKNIVHETNIVQSLGNWMKKQKKLMYAALFVSIAIIIGLTNSRQGFQSIWESLYDNFTCFVPLFDATSADVINAGDLTLFVTSLDGLCIIVNVMCAFLGIHQPFKVNVLSKYDSPFIPIGGGKYANAYLPYMFNFFLDGRVIGIIIGSAIFAIWCAKSTKRALQYPSKKNAVFYLLMTYVVCRSTIRWALGKADFFIAVVVLLMCFKLRFAGGTNND